MKANEKSCSGVIAPMWISRLSNEEVNGVRAQFEPIYSSQDSTYKEQEMIDSNEDVFQLQLTTPGGV